MGAGLIMYRRGRPVDAYDGLSFCGLDHFISSSRVEWDRYEVWTDGRMAFCGSQTI